MRQNFFRKIINLIGPFGPNQPFLQMQGSGQQRQQLSISIPALTWEMNCHYMEDGFDEHLQHVIRRRNYIYAKSMPMILIYRTRLLQMNSIVSDLITPMNITFKSRLQSGRRW